MLPPHLCSICEQRLTEAANAMRYHASLMSRTIRFSQSGSATEEQMQDFRIQLVLSFNDAQTAWDAYREHLIEHGFLPSAE